MRKSVKVAGATGFWGETPIGMSKLLELICLTALSGEGASNIKSKNS